MRRAAWVACALLGACEPGTNTLDFQIRFDDGVSLERAARLQARILLGGCDGEETLYESSFAPSERGPLPAALGSGRYGFAARAIDDGCSWYAAGCSELSLPANGAAVAIVTLEALAQPALDCASEGCSALACGGGEDGGTADASSRDARAPVGGEDDDAGPAAVDAGPPITLEIEAESADPLRAPMVRTDDPMVSGGAYISYPWTEDQTLEQRNMLKRSTPPADDDADGLAIYDFELAAAGQFRLWGRVNVPTLEEDSYWLRIDDEPWIQWNDISHETPWHWDDVRPFESRNERFLIPLAPGPHRIVVSYRELGAMLDKLVLTSDLDFVPSG